MSDVTTGGPAGSDGGPDGGADPTLGSDLAGIAELTAGDVRGFLDAITEVASGTSSATALPLMLLATSQVINTGARLGAIGDVVPAERFEPDPGPDADVEPIRVALANLLEGLDEYVEVQDPITSGEVIRGAVSDDLAEIASALVHGLRHHDAGRTSEALWWWQFSYLSAWGDRATCALRVLLSVLSHVRLDADEDTVADAEFDALHQG